MVSVTRILKAVFSNFTIVLTLQACSPHNTYLLNRIGTLWNKWFAVPPRPILRKPHSPNHSMLNRLNWINGSSEVVFYECFRFLPLNPFFMPLNILKMYNEDDTELFERIRRSWKIAIRGDYQWDENHRL